jgi:hypothetical protein
LLRYRTAVEKKRFSKKSGDVSEILARVRTPHQSNALRAANSKQPNDLGEPIMSQAQPIEATDTARPVDPSADAFWTRYVDRDQRIEVDIPVQWLNHASRGYLLDLHAPDDPWTVLQLSFHFYDRLKFGERVNELITEDSSRWALQRKGSLIHNGVGAIEADFSLQSNGSSWLMRKLYIPHSEGLFALAFMTRLATWSRYGAIYRGVHRSFSPYTGKPMARSSATAHRSGAPRVEPSSGLLLL